MEWLLNFGYFGMFFGGFLAATIVPFSSDVLLIGLIAAGGDPIISVVTATIGNWLGGLTSYGLGRLGKWEWIEKWFRVTKDKLQQQKEKIDRWGSVVAFLSWLPIVGDVLAIAMGFYKTPFINTSLFMLIGKAFRYVLWALLTLSIFPIM